MTTARSPVSVSRTKSREVLWEIILAPTHAPAKTPARTPGQRAYVSKTDLIVFGGQGGLNSSSAMTILRHGISGRVIDPLSEYLDVGKGELAVMLDLDRTTAQRRAGRNEPLPMHSAESVLRLLELEDMANATFESEEAALQWLRRPHPMLDNDSPLEAAKTSFGARRVKDIMVSVKYGGVV